jgi:lipoprotein-anchoring transpeptidase ErfK/SrfK
MKQRGQITVAISTADQRLVVRNGGVEIRSFPISTSRFGLGFKQGSMKTPSGRFRVAEKIGAGARAGTVFKSRRPVAASQKHAADADLIMSRILWLDGLGRRNANTRERYIYIHGTNHDAEIGRATSHGCVRMTNADVVELFNLVDVGTLVTISRTTSRRRRGD